MRFNVFQSCKNSQSIERNEERADNLLTSGCVLVRKWIEERFDFGDFERLNNCLYL